MVDRGGRARLTILEPPWAAREEYSTSPLLMIMTKTLAEFQSSTSNLFSFGVVTAEVRLVYLASYSVGGGEMENLTSA